MVISSLYELTGQQPVDKSRIASTWFGNWLSNPSNVFGSLNQTNLSPFLCLHSKYSGPHHHRLLLDLVQQPLAWAPRFHLLFPKANKGRQTCIPVTPMSPLSPWTTLVTCWAGWRTKLSCTILLLCRSAGLVFLDWNQVALETRVLGGVQREVMSLIDQIPSCDGKLGHAGSPKSPSICMGSKQKQGRHGAGFIFSETLLV